MFALQHSDQNPRKDQSAVGGTTFKIKGTVVSGKCEREGVRNGKDDIFLHINLIFGQTIEFHSHITLPILYSVIVL